MKTITKEYANQIMKVMFENKFVQETPDVFLSQLQKSTNIEEVKKVPDFIWPIVIPTGGNVLKKYILFDSKVFLTHIDKNTGKKYINRRSERVYLFKIRNKYTYYK